jgi:hypothetical protein
LLAKDLHVLPDDSCAVAVAAFQRASCNLTDPFVGPMRLSRYCQLLAMHVERT